MKNNGFTLIELLIVFAILLIFFMITIPAYQGYVAKQTANEKMKHLDFKDRPRQYIDNTIRDNSTQAEIKIHSDGTKYVCIDDDKCYKVK